MMNCIPCFSCMQKDDEDIHHAPVRVQPKVDQTFSPQTKDAHVRAQPNAAKTFSPQPTGYIPWTKPPEAKVNNIRKDTVNRATPVNSVENSDIEATQYTFRELATATKYFRQECLIGECGYGRIYKGTLQPSGQIVIVKRLDKHSSYGNKEFLVEVHMLSLLSHSNLLNLVGYCADGDQRLLVYEYMPMGSVQEHLLGMDVNKKSLDWGTRMKIACGIAQAIEYLHDKVNPSVIYRDLKCTNVMLDKDFNPKLSDHGLARLVGNNQSQVTLMGTYGYCAPEYEKHNQLTVKSNVYNFGVVLLELITGSAAVDISKTGDEQNLVKWAQPIFRDPRRFSEMADLRLNNSFPVKSLNQAVGIAAMCLQDEPNVRPVMADVVAALTSLLATMEKDGQDQITKQEKKALSRKQTRNASRRDQSEYGDMSECSWSDYSDEESDNETQYDQKDHTNQYDQKETRVAEDMGYRENQNDQEDIHSDEEISYHKNQHDQKDTSLGAKIGYHDNQYDSVSTDEESDTDEDQDKHEHVCTDEESDTDEDQDEHERVCTVEKIGYKENQYAEDDACGSEEERGYNENNHEQNGGMDEESSSDYDSESSKEDVSPS